MDSSELRLILGRAGSIFHAARDLILGVVDSPDVWIRGSRVDRAVLLDIYATRLDLASEAKHPRAEGLRAFVELLRVSTATSWDVVVITGGGVEGAAFAGDAGPTACFAQRPADDRDPMGGGFEGPNSTGIASRASAPLGAVDGPETVVFSQPPVRESFNSTLESYRHE